MLVARYGGFIVAGHFDESKKAKITCGAKSPREVGKLREVARDE